MARRKPWYKRVYFLVQRIPALGPVVTYMVRSVLMTRKIKAIDHLKDEIQQLSLAVDGLRGTVSSRAEEDNEGFARALTVIAGGIEALDHRLQKLEDREGQGAPGSKPAGAVALQDRIVQAFKPSPVRPLVSMVINTYNRAHTLPQTLRSLRHLRYEPFEVIVVNGPSTDDTEEILAKQADDLTVLSCPEPNLSMSRNIGIAAARGDIVAFIDDDAVPEPDWIDRIIAPFHDPAVGAAGGFTRDNSGVTFQCKVVAADRFGDGTGFDSVEEAAVDEGPGQPRVLSTTGTNAAFRRDALLDIGGFDEEYAYFLDETDVNVRMTDAGWRTVIVPEAEIHHKYAPSHLRDERRVPRSMYIPARSKAYFAYRHAGSLYGSAAVMTYLADYLKREVSYKKGNVACGEIDQRQYEKLTEETRQGVQDGVRDALSGERPKLIGSDTLDVHKDRTFRPFDILRPAETRLRLAMLCQSWDVDTDSGITVWTREVATGLAARGHEVSIVTVSPHGLHTVDFEGNLWIHRIVPEQQAERLFPPMPDVPATVRAQSIAAFDEVMRIKLRRGLDLVSGPIWDLEPMATLAAGALPTVVSLHTTAGLALPSKPDWLNNPIYKRDHVDKVIAGESELLRTAPALLANSRALCRDLEETHQVALDAERVSVIPHGLSDVYGGAPRERVDGTVRIAFVGRLETRKGADLLLAVLPGILGAHPEAEAHLVGDDTIPAPDEPLRDAFLRMHNGAAWLSRVHFRGRLPRTSLDTLLANADIVVVPSRYESFGLVVVEAFRAGAACVATRIGGMAETVEHDKTGLLVDPEDPAALGDAIEQLVADPARRRALGQAGRAAYEIRYSDTVMIEALEAYFAKIAGVSRRLESQAADRDTVLLRSA